MSNQQEVPPSYELDGVIEDYERNGTFDAVSLATVKRVREAIVRGEHRIDGITHCDSCWSFGPRHYECAVREVERLRESNRKLHRRCQEAESALPDYKRIIAKPPDGDGVRFVSGSFGRALLAGMCNMMRAEIAGLREQHARDSAELAALRKRIEDAPVLAVDAGSLLDLALPVDLVAQTQDAYENAKVAVFEVQAMLARAGLPASVKKVRLVVEE